MEQELTTSKECSYLIVSLRHNIVVEEDVRLAECELIALCGSRAPQSVSRIGSLSELHNIVTSAGCDSAANSFISQNLRNRGTIALLVRGATVTQFSNVISRCAFGQNCIWIGNGQVRRSQLVKKLTRLSKYGNQSLLRGVTLTSLLEYSTRLVFGRRNGSTLFRSLDVLLDYMLDGAAIPTTLNRPIRDAINAKKTSLYLTHELHLYKGKFFPRLLRGLINRYANGDNVLVVDPFVGSGTTLLDAALMGHRSIGIDVDPTSVFISSEKLTPANVQSETFQHIYAAVKSVVNDEETGLFAEPRYSLANWQAYRINAPEPMRGRLIKRGREEGYDLLAQIEDDSAKVLCLIDQAPAAVQPIMRVCLSHALTKKLRLRFVGIGNGRFTIDVAKVGVLDLFVRKLSHLVAIAEVFEWLQANGLKLGQTTVLKGSAIDLPTLMGDKKADLIITSPPYLPASSGREHYARARAIPLVFTGAASVDELDSLDSTFIGEMSSLRDSLSLEHSMPPAVRRTLEFLRYDEQRKPKYIPTLNYYLDLKRVLIGVRKTLASGGRALFIVATGHTFYIHKTKQILHTVDAAKALSELGEQCGLRVVETILIPLQKSGGLNARPRSRDEYSETVIVFSIGPE